MSQRDGVASGSGRGSHPGPGRVLKLPQWYDGAWKGGVAYLDHGRVRYLPRDYRVDWRTV